MIVDWTGETIAWIVLGASTFYLADRLVIWLVTRQSGIFDPDGDMPAALARVRRPGPAQSWGYISVQPYYLR